MAKSCGKGREASSARGTGPDGPVFLRGAQPEASLPASAAHLRLAQHRPRTAALSCHAAGPGRGIARGQEFLAATTRTPVWVRNFTHRNLHTPITYTSRNANRLDRPRRVNTNLPALSTSLKLCPTATATAVTATPKMASTVTPKTCLLPSSWALSAPPPASACPARPSPSPRRSAGHRGSCGQARVRA